MFIKQCNFSSSNSEFILITTHHLSTISTFIHDLLDRNQPIPKLYDSCRETAFIQCLYRILVYLYQIKLYLS